MKSLVWATPVILLYTYFYFSTFPNKIKDKRYNNIIKGQYRIFYIRGFGQSGNGKWKPNWK